MKFLILTNYRSPLSVETKTFMNLCENIIRKESLLQKSTRQMPQPIIERECITKQKVSLLMKSNLHVMPKSLQNVLPKILRLQLKMQQQTQKKLFLSLMRSTKLLRHQRSWLIKQKLQSQAGLEKRQWKINNDLSIILTSNKFTSSHLF